MKPEEMQPAADMRKPMLPSWNLMQCNSNILTRRRYSHTAVVWEGKMYLWGGLLPDVSPSISVYDIKNKSWSEITFNNIEIFPTSSDCTDHHIATVHGSGMFIHGGDQLWRFDLHSHTWAHINISQEDSPPYRKDHCGTLVQDTWYIFGGQSNHVFTLNDLWLLNMNTLVWSRIAQSPAPPAAGVRKGCMASYLTNILLIIGSEKLLYRGELSPDSTSIQWTEEEMPRPRSGHAVASVNKRVFMFGGYDLFGGLPDTWYRYNSAAQTWVRLQPSGHFPSQRIGHTLCHHDGLLYLFGGCNKTDILNDLYTISSSTWVTLSEPSPSQRALKKPPETFVLQHLQKSCSLLHEQQLQQQRRVSDRWGA